MNGDIHYAAMQVKRATEWLNDFYENNQELLNHDANVARAKAEHKRLQGQVDEAYLILAKLVIADNEYRKDGK